MLISPRGGESTYVPASFQKEGEDGYKKPEGLPKGFT